MLGRNQHLLVEDGQLKKKSVIRVIHYIMVDFSATNKLMSVIQLELRHSEAVQRIGHPITALHSLSLLLSYSIIA